MTGRSWRAPRVYALDVVVPAAGTGEGPFVVDLNGSRAGLSFPGERGRDVEEEVLRSLAAAGAGRIYSLVQQTVPTLREHYSSEFLLSNSPHDIGISRLADAYVPMGPSFSTTREQRVRDLARAIGIDYRTLFANWDERELDFRLSEEGNNRGLLRDWDPGHAVIWPYSWDRRAFALPSWERVVAPLSIHLITTNKLFAAAVAARHEAQSSSQLMPYTGAWGFHLESGDALRRISEELSDSRLVIIKPASGMRSFGVIVAPSNVLSELAIVSGVMGSQSNLQLGVRIFAAASLTGDLPEVCSLVQPYIKPTVRRHPRTGQLHNTVHRAIILADRMGVRCLSVRCLLAQVPRGYSGGEGTRSSLLMLSHDEPICVDPRPDEFAAVRNVSEAMVVLIENHAASAECEPRSLLEHEALETASFADRTFDLSVLDEMRSAWRNGQPISDLIRNLAARRR